MLNAFEHLLLVIECNLFDIHDFFERLTKFWIEDGVNNWIHKTVHVAKPCCENEYIYTGRTL